MNDINIDITGNPILKMIYPNMYNGWAKYSKNNTTDKFVGKQQGTDEIVSNLLCDTGAEMTYTHMNFGTIGGVDITSNDVLFNELEKLL